MTVSLRERRRQLLYDEILTAVGELLGEKGYSAMSMDELAARVGISKPTLYSIFPFFVCTFLLLDWIAARTSHDKN